MVSIFNVLANLILLELDCLIVVTFIMWEKAIFNILNQKAANLKKRHVFL